MEHFPGASIVLDFTEVSSVLTQLCGVSIVVIVIYRWGGRGPERLKHLPWVTQLDVAELGASSR